jgi:hypothetical protein
VISVGRAGFTSTEVRRRDGGSGATLVIQADEAYRAIIEACPRLANCCAQAVSKLEPLGIPYHLVSQYKRGYCLVVD